MQIPFGEWLPDQPDTNNPGSLTATNVLPGAASYLQMPSLTTYSSALTARCQGAVYGKDTAGVTYNFAGDATKLYKMSSAVFSDVSKSGGYTTASDARWFFTQYGSQILATNFTDPIQTYTLGSSTLFANLSATAPNARSIAQIQDFTLVGNTSDAIDGAVPHRVRWSAIGDPTSWTVSATTQADYQDLDSSKGWVQQVFGGEYGVIFQERAISVMTYVGSPQIFQFREVETGRGLLAPGGATKIGNYIAYLGIDGFYIFDGNQSTPISENKIRQYFFSDLDDSYRDRICSCTDMDKQIVYWSYPGSGNTSGNCNRILAYNFSPNAKMRWSIINVDTEVLYISMSEGYSMDSLDSLSGSLDALDSTIANLDSRALTGENYILSAFDLTHKLSLFTGSAMSATIDTTEGQLFQGKRGMVTLLRPMVQGTTASVTLSIGTRNNLNESVTFGSSLSANSFGEYPTRSNARYHRARVSITGGFDHAEGVQILKSVELGQR